MTISTQLLQRVEMPGQPESGCGPGLVDGVEPPRSTESPRWSKWETFRRLILPGITADTSLEDAIRFVDPHNQNVTRSYTGLSDQMGQCLDADGAIVDWCGFASWVSFSLGAFLRPAHANPALARHPLWRRLVISRLLPRLLTTEQWMGLAAGNFQIFEEMRAIYELVFSFSGDSLAKSLSEADRRTDALWYGDVFKGTEPTPADRYWARHAVKSMLLAAAAEDRGLKSELMFSANVALSAIEQRRADVQIDNFFEGMVTNRWWIPKPLRKVALKLTVSVTTRWLTHFLLPDGFVSVGKPLALPDAGDYPSGANRLDEITSPWARTVLDAFWTGQQPRSDDWTDYGQRMAFIAGLFRAYQEIPPVLEFAGLPRPRCTTSRLPLFIDVDPAEVTSARPEPSPPSTD